MKPLEVREPCVLTIEELDELAPLVCMLEDWIKEYKNLVQALLEDGIGEFKNAKLQAKRPFRRWWAPEGLVRETLQETLASLDLDSSDDVVAPRKVLTPAEAEKMVGKDHFQKLLAGLVKAESSGMNLKLFSS